MLSQFIGLVTVNLKASLRDRVLHSVVGVALFILLLVPILSSFSMRQVQELSITLALSASSMVLLVSSLLLGASTIWRDIERRYITSVLTLPISRSSYLLAKFVSCALFLILSGVVLAVASTVVIQISTLQYPSDVPIAWDNVVFAMMFDVLKYVLLVAIALTLSADPMHCPFLEHWPFSWQGVHRRKFLNMFRVSMVKQFLR